MKRRNVKKNKIKLKIPKIDHEKLKAKFKDFDTNTFFVFGSIGLVLVLGLYALFSSSARNERLANPACGKIVVAADGISLRSSVAPSLCGARYFLVINPLTNKLLESSKNPYLGKPSREADVAYLVAGKGEEAVIAGSIDPYITRILAQMGIRSFSGYDGKVKDVVDLYRQARISQVPQQGMYARGGAGFGMQVGKLNMLLDGDLKDLSVRLNANRGQTALSLPDSFLCPQCGWRFGVPQGQTGFPKCPNCQTIIRPEAGVLQGTPFNIGADSSQPFGGNAFRYMQDLNQAAQQDVQNPAAAAAWGLDFGGGTCVLK